MRLLRLLLPALAAAGLTVPAAAADVAGDAGNAPAPFDITRTDIRMEEHWLVFTMEVAGEAGSSTPTPIGELAGAMLHAYVWPTGMDPDVVGFEPGSGTLAFVVTSHPDFDDTPLFDENRDGNRDNDGLVWHTHWVVLVPDEACGGPNALKVRDIGEGEDPALPITWPDMPIYIDSPGYTPVLTGGRIETRVPVPDLESRRGATFDGVTARLRVNPELTAPLLCVVEVFDVASGDLSQPGRVE